MVSSSPQSLLLSPWNGTQFLPGSRGFKSYQKHNKGTVRKGSPLLYFPPLAHLFLLCCFLIWAFLRPPIRHSKIPGCM